MTPVDFAAAEQRAADRRKARAADLQTGQHIPRSNYALETSNHFPYPLNHWSRTGIQIWDKIKGREGARPDFRVGQVDAELLDEELLELLTVQVGDALKYIGAHLRDDWSSEISLGLRAVLFKMTIWDHDASYGAALQNLRYTDARHSGPVAKAPTHWQKGWYGLLSVGGRYGWEKWDTWLAEQEVSYHGPTANVRFWSQVSSLVSTAHSIAAFCSFLLFLTNGRYRTLLDRILHLRLTSPTSHLSRQVSFEYLNRQLVWHAFTEFLLFLLPLVGISRWRRWLVRAWRKAKAIFKPNNDEGDVQQRGELAFLPERTCAICYQDQNPTTASENEILAVSGASGGVVGSAHTDITNPYEMIPCSCVYCFVCAATRLEAAEGEAWTCLRCGELVKKCKPWTGDVVEAPAVQKSKKNVSFTDANGKVPAVIG